MSDHDWTWSHFMHHLLHELAHVDSKIFRSFWLLARRPGFLTSEYWAGRRVPYLTPLRIYLICAAVHFVAVHYGLFRTDFIRIDRREASTGELVDLVAAKFHFPPDTLPELRHLFETVYKLSVYLGPLVLGMACWLWFRKHRPYFVQHLIFAIHVYAFWFLLTPLNGLWEGFRGILPLVTTVYLYFAAKQLYGGTFWPNFGRAVFLRVAHVFAQATAIAVALAASILWSLAAKGH